MEVENNKAAPNSIFVFILVIKFLDGFKNSSVAKLRNIPYICH